jgi:hypothetical protein
VPGVLDRTRIPGTFTGGSKRNPGAADPNFPVECPSEGGGPLVQKARKDAQGKGRKAARPTRRPKINEEEEEILKKAQIYLLFEAKRPMLWTVADIREEKGDDGSRRWVIAVNLRYPTGHEGYLGDLLYDGVRITELTDLELMRERARQIGAHPERDRKWHEYRASTLPPGEG